MSLLLLRDARVFAPAPLGIVDVLVGGGRILAVGPGRIEAPAGIATEVIDLEGRRLIPGLVDCHVHVTGGGGEAGFRTRVPPLAPSRSSLALSSKNLRYSSPCPCFSSERA